ncbi:DUF4012 domain-containing protein [Candidatus Falkowbacteria bacterium]|nr:DUF4012 domain-containing protein [Candidatus Falkowbacteria bacterium]
MNKKIKKTTPNIRLNKRDARSGENQKPNEPLTFGLLQHEIDGILAHHQKDTNRELEQSVMKELAKLLPAGETIGVKHPHHHTDIIVKPTTARSSHSSFVLDLTELAKKQKEKAEKKRILSLLRRRGRELPTSSKSMANEKPKHKAAGELGPTVIFRHEERIAVLNHLPSKRHYDEHGEQFTKAPWFYHLNLPYDWPKKIVIYTFGFLLCIAPIKAFGYYHELKNSQAKIVNYATEAYADIKIASQNLLDEKTGEAREQFAAAEKNLFEAENELDKINAGLKILINLIPRTGPNLADAEYLLDAGAAAADIGQQITNAFEALKSSDKKLTERLANAESDISSIAGKVNSVNSLMNKIRPEALPENKRAQFSQIKNYLSSLANDLTEFSELSKTINEILGADYLRRYLFVFQNNNEIRATGGFIGSFALVDIDRGEIKNIEIPSGGSYDLQGSLLAKRKAPYPLTVINPLWEMQDANWLPDFPSSAQKIKWFYENAGGPTVDGVISVNASLIPAILEIIGPINLPDYGQSLNAKNFIIELQKSTSALKNTAKPKQLLADLAPEFLKKLFGADKKTIITIAQAVKKGLAEKDIQLYFANQAIEEKIASYGWAGKMLNSSRDYLAVVSSNIGGGKTDAFIEQNINLVSNIADDGTIINTLAISRKHTGSANDQFGKISNLSFVRIYTPAGSELLEITGHSSVPANKFEKPETAWQEDEWLAGIQGKIWIDPTSGTQINNEFDKTVFGNWLQVDSGEERQLIIKYRLPFRFSAAQKSKLTIFSNEKHPEFYSFLLQKQSGVQNTKFNITINLPTGYSATKTFGHAAINHFDQIKLESSLADDALLAFIAE